MNMCNITLEIDHLNQRFAINGALFSQQNNISKVIYFIKYKARIMFGYLEL